MVSAAINYSNAATFCDGCDQLTAGREACAGPTRSGSRPVGGTSAGILAGRVLRDGSATCTPATCSVPVGRSSYGTAMTRVKGPCTSVSHADDRGTHAAGARAAPVLVCSNLVLVCSNPPAAGSTCPICHLTYV